MSKANPEKEPLEVNVAKVERHKGAIKIPEEMTMRQARDVLDRQMRYDEEEVSFQEYIPGFVGDASLALYNTMKARYGWANQEATYSWFGKIPPPMIGIPTGPNGQQELVPMGKFTLPGIDGWIHTVVERNPDDEYRFQLKVYAQTKRENEREVRGLIDEARLRLKTESVYRGKAFKIKFTDSSGEEQNFPTILFTDPTRVDENSLVLPRHIERDISARIWAPLRYPQLTYGAGVKAKRGALLAGQPGCGKTLIALITAKIAVENHTTFMYVEKASDLVYALKAAAQLGGRICVFCEDIDRVTSGDRDAAHDELLNLLDGVDTKNSELMVVFTSNNPDKIGEAFRRPGRIDALIPIPPPDQEAAERLIRKLAGKSLPVNADVAAAAEYLVGQIPSVIEEAVATAKLYAIDAHQSSDVTVQDLIDAARSMQTHIKMLEPKQADSRTALEKFGVALATGATNAMLQARKAVGGSDAFDEAVHRIEATSTKGATAGAD